MARLAIDLAPASTLRHDARLRARERRQALATTIVVAVAAGFPLIRTSNLFSASTVRDTNYAEGSVLLPVVFGSIFMLAAWVLWMNRQTALRNLRALNPFLLLILLWCACTAFWSPYPVTTVKRTVQLAGLILIGLAVAPPLGNLARFAGTVLSTFTVLLFLCLLVALALPQVGVDYQLGGAWRGIFWHKNIMGIVSAFTVLLWLRQWRESRLDWRVCLAGGLFALMMLVLAKSTTSLIIAMTGSALYLFLARDYVRGRHVTAIAVLGAALLAMLGLHLFYSVMGRLPYWEELVGPIAGLFNKSADLTGRMDIWQLVALEIAKHPWQGIGYGAYWLGVGSPSQYAIDILHYIPLQAHNGYLDVLNELGLIGLALVAAMLAWHAWQLARLIRIDRAEGAFHWAFFVLIVIANISESILFRGVQFEYFWLICSSAMVSARLRLHRQALADARP
ncbi:O-antigen ligase family protein [Orrella sp. JC864]|uniref:O-antigen ligase family protein n=1 Tax=Orrella sp. JC864 TaxID=3120298 RepID=UPI003009884A